MGKADRFKMLAAPDHRKSGSLQAASRHSGVVVGYLGDSPIFVIARLPSMQKIRLTT